MIGMMKAVNIKVEQTLNREESIPYSKKSLLNNDNVIADHLNKNDPSAENRKKLSEKLEKFKSLNKPEDKKDKDETDEYQNLEGLLLSQRQHLIINDPIVTGGISNISLEKKMKQILLFSTSLSETNEKARIDRRVNNKNSQNKVHTHLSNLLTSKVQNQSQDQVVKSNNHMRSVEIKKSSQLETRLNSKKTLQSEQQNSHDLMATHQLNNNTQDILERTTNDNLIKDILKQNKSNHNLKQDKNIVLSSINKKETELVINNDKNISKQQIIDNNLSLMAYPLQSTPQHAVSTPLSAQQLLDMPALSLLHKQLSTLTQPPSITYVFKQWGNQSHQIQINFIIDRQIQLIASTGRVYQSSLEKLGQYQGRLNVELANESKSHDWQINAIDSYEYKEDEEE